MNKKEANYTVVKCCQNCNYYHFHLRDMNYPICVKLEHEEIGSYKDVIISDNAICDLYEIWKGIEKETC